MKIYDRERGASMVEYALLVVLIAIVALIAISLAGDAVSGAFSSVASGFDTPADPGGATGGLIGDSQIAGTTTTETTVTTVAGCSGTGTLCDE